MCFCLYRCRQKRVESRKREYTEQTQTYGHTHYITLLHVMCVIFRYIQSAEALKQYVCRIPTHYMPEITRLIVVIHIVEDLRYLVSVQSLGHHYRSPKIQDLICLLINLVQTTNYIWHASKYIWRMLVYRRNKNVTFL